jgi:hypothetical protein
MPEPATQRVEATVIGTAPTDQGIPVATTVEVDAHGPATATWADEPTVRVPTTYADEAPVAAARDLDRDLPFEEHAAVDEPFVEVTTEYAATDVDIGSSDLTEPFEMAGPDEATDELPVATAEPAVPPVEHVSDEEAWEAWASSAPPADAALADAPTPARAGARDGNGRPSRATAHDRAAEPETDGTAGDRAVADAREPENDEDLWRAWQLPEAGKR